MADITIYFCNSYREIIEKMHDREEKKRGFFSRMAEAMKCHRSLIPQVMRGDVNLTLDQGADLCNFFAFNDEDTMFFLDLLSLERSGSRKLKKLLQSRLSEQVKKKQKVAAHVDSNAIVSKEIQMEYYTSWVYAAVHVLIGIPEFNQEAQIAEKLNLSLNQVISTTNKLIEMGLIEREKGRLKITEKKIHLPSSSPLAAVSNLNWRIKSASNANFNSDNISYTGVFAISKELKAQFKEQFLSLIRDVHSRVESSNEEILVCLNLDLFEP